MNRAQALARLRKLWPKHARAVAISTHRNAPKDAEEAEAMAALRSERSAARKAIDAQRDARRAEILAADVEYQRLKLEAEAARKLEENTPSGFFRPYDVGYADSIFFHVRGSGYTLREAVEDAERRADK